MKICVLCAANNNNFIKDIGKNLALRHYITGYDDNANMPEWNDIANSDVVWMEWFDGSTISLLMFPKPNPKIKYIVRLHRYELFTKRTLQQLDDITKKEHYKKIDKLVFVSEYVRKIGINKYPWMRDISVVIPNLIDMDKFSFIEREAGNKILFLGKLAYVKNLPLLLACFHEVYKTYPNYELHIVGNVWDEEIRYYIQNFQKKAGVPNIFCHGYIPNHALSAFTKNMSYIACTSVIESQGIGILECMAMGMMPVIYNFGGAEIIFSEKYLFISPQEFANTINFYSGRKYDSCEYRDFVMDNYSIQTQIGLYDNLLKDVSNG